MIQRFIELGEGYSDLYELVELMKHNEQRIERILALHTVKDNRNVTSFAVAMKLTDPGKFQAIYFCREGIPDPRTTPNKRFDLFREQAEKCGHALIELEVQPSSRFAETALYYQYLTGVLRMNRYIQPLQ